MILDTLIGTWSTEATHPAMPGLIVRGTATVEWLDGNHFLILRSRTDHPDFPDAITIIGVTEEDRVAGPGQAVALDPAHMTAHYFDSRGVFRVLQASVDATAWRMERLAAGFSQRFTGTFADGGDTIRGLWEMNKDGVTWTDDLAITFRRAP
jgi:hypothetical protein